MIILLGLQILRVANQLINSSSDADLGLPSFPIPLFDKFVLNYKPLRSIDNKNRDSNREQNSNQTYFANKFDSNNNFNVFSKRNGFYGTPGNQSIAFDGQTGKYTKHMPKPYPYSRDQQNSDQNVYSYRKPNYESNIADEKFSTFDIKPNWNEFEDSIDSSLNEPKTYYPNKPQLKNEEKRDEESTPQNDDTFENDYNDNDSDYPPDFDNNNDNNSDNNSDGYDGPPIDEDDVQQEDNPESAKYREEETPECAYGHSYCFMDDEYPEDSMRNAVDKQMDILTQILPESTETFDLVEGIPKEVDENYTFIDSPHDLYNSESSHQISDDEENEVLQRDGGYICPSYVNYIKPKRAQNNDGLWKVILNMNESYRGVDYNQHIRIEECVYEKTKCSFAPKHYLTSECIQKYSNERLLAWTPDKGIHLDVFRLPIACSCHLTPNK